MVDTIDLKSIEQKSLVWVRLPPLVLVTFLYFVILYLMIGKKVEFKIMGD